MEFGHILIPLLLARRYSVYRMPSGASSPCQDTVGHIADHLPADRELKNIVLTTTTCSRTVRSIFQCSTYSYFMMDERWFALNSNIAQPVKTNVTLNVSTESNWLQRSEIQHSTKQKYPFQMYRRQMPDHSCRWCRGNKDLMLHKDCNR